MASCNLTLTAAVFPNGYYISTKPATDSLIDESRISEEIAGSLENNLRLFRSIYTGQSNQIRRPLPDQTWAGFGLNEDNSFKNTVAG